MNDQARAIMRSLPDLVPQKLNLNGTSKDDLLIAYGHVLQALARADMVMAGAIPHGRDYQSHSDPDAAIKARQAWNVRRAIIDEIRKEIEQAAIMVSDQ